MGKFRKSIWLAGIVSITASLGCNPFGMGIFTPIPVPPWVTERMEEKYCYKNDHRTPILPPIRDGFPPPVCEDRLHRQGSSPLVCRHQPAGARIRRSGPDGKLISGLPNGDRRHHHTEPVPVLVPGSSDQ